MIRYMVLISDGNSIHVAHVLKKADLLKKKIRFVTVLDLFGSIQTNILNRT